MRYKDVKDDYQIFIYYMMMVLLRQGILKEVYGEGKFMSLLCK